MPAFDAFLPHIRPRVQQCPDNILIDEARKKAIEFCERSTWWREEVEIAVVAGTHTYTLPAPDNVLVASAVTPATFEGEPVVKKKRPWLDSYYPEWRTQESSMPCFFRMTETDELRLVPTPSRAGSFQITVAYKPGPTATTIPDRIFNEWYIAISSGVLGELFAWEGEPYFKPKLVDLMLSKFEMGVRQAKQKAVNEYTSSVTDEQKRVVPLNY